MCQWISQLFIVKVALSGVLLVVITGCIWEWGEEVFLVTRVNGRPAGVQRLLLGLPHYQLWPSHNQLADACWPWHGVPSSLWGKGSGLKKRFNLIVRNNSLQKETAPGNIFLSQHTVLFVTGQPIRMLQVFYKKKKLPSLKQDDPYIHLGDPDYLR